MKPSRIFLGAPGHGKLTAAFCRNRMIPILAAALVMLVPSPKAKASFTLVFSSADIGTSGIFNDVTSFNFEISVAGSLVAGGTYINPALNSVNYQVQGVLSDPTPSGFPGFNLVRSINGADFYNLSPDAALSFSVSASADLSDGLQMSELAGAGTVFSMNLRELNQNPGRYHPPILTLASDGTGRLVNANNMSTFPNPPPPTGSGQLVDVNVGDEYDVALSFSNGLTVAIPESSSLALVVFATGLLAARRRSRGCQVTSFRP